MNTDWFKEKWISNGCRVSNDSNDVADDVEIQREAILALERTIDSMMLNTLKKEVFDLILSKFCNLQYASHVSCKYISYLSF